MLFRVLQTYLDSNIKKNRMISICSTLPNFNWAGLTCGYHSAYIRRTNSPIEYDSSNSTCFLCLQFQGLFNSRFWVLFTFPTRYLFPIGFMAVFSFRRDIPPFLRLHSQATRLITGFRTKFPTLFQEDYRGITFYAISFQRISPLLLPKGKEWR